MASYREGASVRIHWNAEEIELVCAQMVKESGSFAERIRVAQKVLPVERRRKLVTAGPSQFNEKFHATLQRFEDAKYDKVPEPEPTPAAAPPPEPEPIPEEGLPTAEIQHSIFEALESAFDAKLLGLVRRVLDDELTPIVERLDKMHGAMDMLVELETRALGSVPPREQQKRVLVIGLLGDQENSVRNAVGHMVRLTFRGSDSIAEMKKTPPQVDLVIMSRFISHSMWNWINSRYGENKVMNVRGGVTRIIGTIRVFAKEEAA